MSEMYKLTDVDYRTLEPNSFQLEMALDKLVEGDDPEAGLILTTFIICDFAKKGIKEFSEKEVKDKYKALIIDHVLINLSKDGLVDTLIDENGEALYKLTDLGRDVAQEFKEQYDD